MRIVVDLQACQNGSRHRGIGRYAMDLTRAMLQTQSGHDFRILLNDRFPDTVSEIQASLADLSRPENFVLFATNGHTTSADLENAWRCRAAELIRANMLDQLEPDAVIVPSLFEGFWDNSVVSVEPRRYVTAVTIHDLIPLAFPDQHLQAPNDRAAYYRKLQSLRHANLILTPSEFVRTEVMRELGTPHDQVITTFEGADDKFSPAAVSNDRRDELKARFGINRPFVLNTSPLEHRKNLEGLIAGFGSLPRKLRDAHQLVIVGHMDAFAVSYLNKLISAEGLSSDQLVLTGRVPDRDLVDLYRSSELFCFPSTSEGFGLPVLEAIRCGTLAIAANTSSLPEVIGEHECLFDPANPVDCATVMEKGLDNFDWRQTAQKKQRAHAATLTWERAAIKTLDAVEKSALKASKIPAVKTTKAIGDTVYVIFAATLRASRMEGVVDRILAELSDQYLPVPVSVGESEHNSWREANYDVHDADWFHSHARPTAQILYIGQHSDIPKLERLIAIHPGFVYLPEDPSAAPITAISDTLPDERLIELYERAGFRALAAHTDERAASSDSVHTRLFARCHGIIIEDQNASSFHTVTISPIPISTRGGNPASLRGKYGLTVNTPVVLAHVGSEAIAAPLVHAFRRSTAANGRNAFLIMLGPKEEGRQPDQAEAPLIGSFPGRTFRKGRGEYRWYKDYLALADAIYVAPDVSPVLASQFAADAKANAKPLLVETTPEAIDGALNPIFDKTPSVETSKASQIAEAMDRLVADSPIKNMQMLLEKIPTSVRDCSPSIADLEDVAIAIAANETATRAPQLLLDVSGLRGLRPPSHLDHRTKAIVQQILTMPLSKRAETVRFDGNGFVYARDLAMQALDIDLPLKNEVLRVRPGDCIIGIDCLRSFDKESWRELETFAQQGAGLTYIEAGKAFFDNPEELCDAIRKYFDHRNSAKANDAAPRSRTSSLASAMLDAGVPVEIVEIKSDDFPRKDYSYVVTGHVLGTYSLAIINRAVSTALEAAHPGRVSVAPVETDPISDLSHMPMDERPLIERLALRSPRGGTNNVIISQHYPVLTPGRNSGDVALALFAHEETRVLPAVAATLNTGFDGILATSTTVAKTLIDSGVTLPVAAIGQPSSSDLYEQLGRITRPNRPISSFLHVSSCFPRKGIDVLLDAWRLAFTINSRVKLVIKTFPNPHNDIEQRIGALRTAHPDVAPIELINEDLDGESLAELYMRADCMVLPTRGEGYNLPALEAMLARLPLIVTGAGGHLDFCSADDARFIHYTMAPSQSHVRSALSLWAEPDVDDLAHALKQAVDPIHLQAIRARAQRARFTALGAADKQSWVARLDAAVDDLEKAPAKRMPKVAWVSTWGVQCGIAQHSEFLFAGLDNDRRSSFAMLCDLRTEPDQGTFVCPTWRSGEHPQRDAIAQEVEAFEADAVVIQHQDGLIAWSELARICDDPRLNKRILVIVLHNPRAINNLSESESRRVKQALRKAARVIVHNVSDVNLMASHGLSDNVTLLPPGVLPARRTPDVRSLNPAIDAPVIGCHGFAFPHKGIDKLIRAAAQLRHRWPGVRLRLVTAEFPDQKSRDTLIGLRHLVAELGLTDAVEWHTSFLPVEEIQDLLSGCDLLVLPYDQSQDSASGAARICLSSLAPTLATRVKIFEEMQHAFATIDGNDPDNLAEDIATLLSQSEMRLAVQNKMAAWLSDFDWTAMMDLTIGMISGLANQRRVGWD